MNGTKNALYFLLRAPPNHSFIFNLRFLYELKHKVRRLSKTVCGIQQNAWTLGKATQSFSPRRLIFKSQQEVLKFYNICVS